MIESRPELTPEKANELARRYFDRVVEQAERRLRQRPPEDPDETRRRLDAARRRKKGGKELLKMQGWDAAYEIANDLLAEEGIVSEVGCDAYRDLCLKLIRGDLEATRVHIGKLKGDSTVDPRDSLFQEWLTTTRHRGPVASTVTRLTDAARDHRPAAC